MTAIPTLPGGARMLGWIWISALVVALDQWTKQLAVAQLKLHQPVHLLPGLDLTLMYNTGAAFSFLRDAGGWQRWLFLGIAVVVSAVVIYILVRKLARDQVWLAVALTLILGGAIGNVWDRALLGHVIDFIDVYYQQHHWPAFNVADSAITVGAAMLIIDGFWPRRPPGAA